MCSSSEFEIHPVYVIQVDLKFMILSLLQAGKYAFALSKCRNLIISLFNHTAFYVAEFILLTKQYSIH